MPIKATGIDDTVQTRKVEAEQRLLLFQGKRRGKATGTLLSPGLARLTTRMILGNPLKALTLKKKDAFN